MAALGSSGLVAGLASAGSWLSATPAAAQARTVDTEKLMAPGPLEEIVLGKEDAPVTIVEYASLTCGHCADFHKDTLPKLKEKYVDTGKARLVMREFPLDQLAWAAFMIARCVEDSKYLALLDILYEKQATWRDSQDPAGELFKIAQLSGMTKEQFDACLKDTELAKKVMEVRERAANEFGVESTPTFFINGTELRGNQPLEEFDELIQPLLES